MAKGGGGEGHYDERRRAAKPKEVTGYADSPEVLAAVVKPRSKPTVVVKKKKPILPPAKKLGQAIPGLRMGAAQAEVRVGDLSRKRDLGPFDDQIVTSSLKRNRDDGDIVNTAAKQDRDTGGFSPASITTAPWSPGGSARSLLNWVKRRGARRMLDM